MIILEKPKAVLLTPPRTGSTTLHEHLPHKKVVYGPPGPNTKYVNHHCTYIPPSFIGYEKYIVVRNPYARAISIYKHCMQVGVGTQHTFDQWCAAYLREENFFFRPCSWYEDQLCQILGGGAIVPEPVDGFIQLERLHGDLWDKLHVMVRLDKRENVILLDREINYTRATAAVINEWADEDFKRYGYARID